MPGKRSLLWPGAPSRCHGNAASLYVFSKGKMRIASGYALADDGLWRQHSWGVGAVDGRVMETTVRSLRYYGFILDDGDESLKFFLANTCSCQFTPVARDKIGRFIRRKMSVALKAKIIEAAQTADERHSDRDSSRSDA